jgi:hypothetical protein
MARHAASATGTFRKEDWLHLGFEEGKIERRWCGRGLRLLLARQA